MFGGILQICEQRILIMLESHGFVQDEHQIVAGGICFGELFRDCIEKFDLTKDGFRIYQTYYRISDL